ncbi:Indole-3-glycerol phosphate synthase [Pseudobythopirellula maris]|uniref:Indole-3-glycerol phosphate synthase n=1 Tax=Pseudobythopirellula maris TaxID=2527991 RepID=A0A5C5ZPS1_9BACT|nr:indole-3-glycerol phosphate synthase TrpC [Pseudobythopirellula maris]TWT88801.1 Indole-3-glycerol phosphate synthase [Pseudobythopirellula maris]
MSVLDKIVATKREEIAAAKLATPADELRRAAERAPAPRDFFAALAQERPRDGGPIKLIAEVKKASPSAGLIREDFDPIEIARTYEAHGASCVSILTDEPYFQGKLEYLRDARAAIGIPALRKDFILDEYQLLEARSVGADAVLLIAECLTPSELKDLHDAAVALGMTPLVELYEPENLDAVLESGARLIGVNNRDLRTFEVDLGHTLRMRERVPADRLLVGESGVKTHDDVRRLADAGVDAILVGESLTREADIGAAVDRLMGR